METEEDLDGIMNLVFEKAVTETGFSVTYAKLCQRIAKVCLASHIPLLIYIHTALIP